MSKGPVIDWHSWLTERAWCPWRVQEDSPLRRAFHLAWHEFAAEAPEGPIDADGIGQLGEVLLNISTSINLRLALDCEQLTETATQRLSHRVALAGAIMVSLATLYHKLGHTRWEDHVRGLEKLFDDLGDLDRGHVAPALTPDAETTALSSASRRVKVQCVRALELLTKEWPAQECEKKRGAGLTPKSAHEIVSKWAAQPASWAGLSISPNTIRNWRDEHRRKLTKESDYEREHRFWRGNADRRAEFKQYLLTERSSAGHGLTSAVTEPATTPLRRDAWQLAYYLVAQEELAQLGPLEDNLGEWIEVGQATISAHC